MNANAGRYVVAVAPSYLLPEEPCRSLSEFVGAGLDGAIVAASKSTPLQLRQSLEQSGLRSRDHAATLVGRKWIQIAKSADVGTRFLVATATDSEPGSFVDRALIRMNPFAIIEGIVAASLALETSEAFLVVRRSFEREYEIMTNALAEAETAGWLERVSIKCVRAGDHYLLTDERAILEVIEGRLPLPRRLSPDVDGLFCNAERGGDGLDRLPDFPNPTVVESIETLANVGAIITNGTRWFRSMGTAVSPGNLLCTITGDVNAHGVIEAELGRRLYDVIEEGGEGYLPTSPPKAVLSGVSSAVLTRSRLSAPLSWEGLAAVGADIGRAAFTVHGENANMIDVAHRIAAFFFVESCGLCPACKFGSGEVTGYLARLVAAVGEQRDVEAINRRLPLISAGSRCDLPARHHEVVGSIVRAFPGDVSDAAFRRNRPGTPQVLEHIREIVAGVALYGTEQSHKRPDWSISEVPVHLTRV